MWLRPSSEPQPYVMLTVTPGGEDYADLGFPLKSRKRSSILPSMADTGCQSCLGGMRLLPRFGMTADDLITVSMKMHAANGKVINIIGAAILRFSGKSPYGEPRDTRQITYITDNSDKLFLSREACISLGMITARFPTVGEVISPSCPQLSCAGSTDETDIDTRRCGCPRRQKPPPVPTKLPYAAHGENRSKLQEYLLDYYSSSTFNTCERQLLPMMQGPPLRLTPPQWLTTPQSQSQSMCIGRRKSKPGSQSRVGPRCGTRCDRASPRWRPSDILPQDGHMREEGWETKADRDMQSLNANATRETHHTQSPFHQARSVPAGMKKTVFDAWNGYHSVALHPDDRHLTTFITPWGRYRYRVALQGYVASGDGYSRRFDEIVSDVPDKTKCIDDTLLWART